MKRKRKAKQNPSNSPKPTKTISFPPFFLFRSWLLCFSFHHHHHASSIITQSPPSILIVINQASIKAVQFSLKITWKARDWPTNARPHRGRTEDAQSFCLDSDFGLNCVRFLTGLRGREVWVAPCCEFGSIGAIGDANWWWNGRWGWVVSVRLGGAGFCGWWFNWCCGV